MAWVFRNPIKDYVNSSQVYVKSSHCSARSEYSPSQVKSTHFNDNSDNQTHSTHVTFLSRIPRRAEHAHARELARPVECRVRSGRVCFRAVVITAEHLNVELTL